MEVHPDTQVNSRPVLPGRASEHAKHMGIKDKSVTPNPDWAHGLKRLYDSVVEEPLPDVFKDLISKLDKPDPE